MNKKELKRQHAIDFILLIPHPSALIPLSPRPLPQAVLTSLSTATWYEKFEKGKFHSPPSGTVDNSPALQEQCEENA